MYPACFPDCSCEPALEGLILQPWAFWTSCAYVLSFIWMFRYLRLLPGTQVWLTSYMLLIFSSFLAHAQFSIPTLAMDQAAVSLLIISIHLPLKERWKPVFFSVLFWCALTGAFVTLPFDSWVPVVSGFFLLSFGIALGRIGGSRMLTKTSMGILLGTGASFLFFIFDQHASYCEGRFLPYGHPVWHLGSALSTSLFAFWWFEDAHARPDLISRCKEIPYKHGNSE